MDTQTEEKVQRTVKTKATLNGIWRLTYKLTNRMGPGGFSGRNLTSYIDAITGRERHLYNLNGDMTKGYFVETQTTLFYPDTNPEHANIVDWLIGHDKIFVEQKQVELDQRYVDKKESNPRIKLVNLDYQDLSSLDEEDYIDKLVGRISSDFGPATLNLEKLRFILAQMNFIYREAKFINNEKVEKQKLRKRLKDYVRQGKAEAEAVNLVLEDMDTAKYTYEVKELVRFDILNNSGGMYKFNSMPLGLNIDSVIKYFIENPDFYSEITGTLINALKKEASK